MAHFYASIDGTAKTLGTRCGSKYSGISGHVRGWDSSVKVIGEHEDGRDVFRVYATGGSNGHTDAQLIATIVDGKVSVFRDGE